jgi:hypothetical protein
MDVTTPAASNGHPAPVLATGDGCPTCGSTLAADQRYCVACGTRRGEPRLPFMDGRPRQVAAPAAAPPPRRHRPHASAGTTLVAGVGTLVLALGVGVLIGRQGNSQPERAAAPVQVITVPGGGAAADTTATTDTSSASTTSSKDASNAADKVLKAKVKLPPPTVTVGSSCKSGAGCQHGKFTGNFFGP